MTSQQLYAQEKLQAIQARIRDAELAGGRAADSVSLVGASKMQTPELLYDFAKSGLQDVGENYLQEAIAKQDAIKPLTGSAEKSLTWHFIGQIQSNKTKLIAQYFNWVHGVDRAKIATRIAKQNPHSEPTKLLIQLNLDSEDSKGGVLPEAAAELANQIAQQLADISSVQAGAELHGFMAIPKARVNIDEQRATFAQARELLDSVNQRYGLRMSQLSMGMSGDLEAAIAEGATMVRIGTDLFGARK